MRINLCVDISSLYLVVLGKKTKSFSPRSLPRESVEGINKMRKIALGAKEWVKDI